MLGGAHGGTLDFEETTSDDDGGSGSESDVGGSGQEPARVVEQGWADFGLEVIGECLSLFSCTDRFFKYFFFRPRLHPGNPGNPGRGRPGGVPGWWRGRGGRGELLE